MWDELTDALRYSPDIRPLERRRSTGTHRCPDGVALRWDTRGSQRKDGTLAVYRGMSLPGAACARLRSTLTPLLQRLCTTEHAHIARLDLALTGRELPAAALVAESWLDSRPGPKARLRRSLRTRFRDESWDLRYQGTAFYLGSPNSARSLRIYDRARRTKDPTAGIRWEIQLRDEYALAAASAWLEDPQAAFRSTLRGMIDCDDAWFRKLVEDLPAARLRAAPRYVTLLGRLRAIRTQYGATLRALVETGLIDAVLTRSPDPDALDSLRDATLADLHARLLDTDRDT